MTVFNDKELKRQIAEAAKAGALQRIAALLGEDYALEVVTDEPLTMQLRVKRNASMYTASVSPRYFLIRISEPI